MGTSIATRITAAIALTIGATGCATLPDRLPGLGDEETRTGAYLQGVYAAGQKHYGEAAKAFDEAVKTDPQDDIYYEAYRYSLMSGRLDRAERYAQTQLDVIAKTETKTKKSFDSFEEDMPRLTLVVAALDDGDILEAERFLDKPFMTPLGESIAHLIKAWIVFEREGVDAAMQHFADAPDTVFKGFNALHVALMMDLAGRSDEAETIFAQSLNGSGIDLSLVAYSLFLERQRDRETALKYDHLLAAGRGYMRRVGRMGLARLGEPLDGESTDFVNMARKSPDYLVQSVADGASLALVNFAWAGYDQGVERQHAAAEAGFHSLAVSFDVPLALAQLAAPLDDDIGLSHYLVGAMSGIHEDYAMAEKAMRQIPTHSWLYNYAVIERSNLFVEMDRPEDAIRLIEKYLKQDALATDVLLTLAELKNEDGDYTAAVQAASKAIKVASSTSTDETRDENLWRYYFARGVIHSEADRWTLAEKDLRTSLELSPTEPVVLNYLGYTYVERGENVDEAFGMIEQALEAMPTSGSITDSLGWAYYQRGEYDKAVTYLERAVSLEPENDTISDHLGDAYWQVGRQTEARYEWRRVLEMRILDDDVASAVRLKLDGQPPAKGALVATGSATPSE